MQIETPNNPPDFEIKPSNDFEQLSRPTNFQNYPPQLEHDDFHHHHHEHEIIYDHIPDHFHYHDFIISTTKEPDLNDQRVIKRPYSYYYIGRKLWYVPLYFSIYFVIYIGALILKSVARHKINFPYNLATAAAGVTAMPVASNDMMKSFTEIREDRRWLDYASQILNFIKTYKNTS